MPKTDRKAVLEQPVIYNKRRLAVCSPEEIEHCESSKWIAKYIDAKALQAPNTAKSYKTRLQAFSQCIFRHFKKISVDQFIDDIKGGKHDPYDVLTVFVKFLTNERKLKANEIRAWAITAKKFMRYCKIPVIAEDFKEQVPMPRKEQPIKTGIEKADIVKYLNACKNVQIKTVLHVLCATGPRPIEACAILERDINLSPDGDKPETITFQAKYSKMRVARTRPLTKEAANQIKVWLQNKYKPRWTTFKENGGYVRKFINPKPDPNSLLLAAPDVSSEQSTPEGLYSYLQEAFAELVDMVTPEPNRKSGQRRKMSLKVFRDFVKSTISDAGHQDFSEWFIGHTGSTYYQKSEKERIALFRKLEIYLTYLDISGLEAKGADNDSKIEAMQQQMVRMERDHKAELAAVMEAIRANPSLSHVKPAVLADKLEESKKTQ